MKFFATVAILAIAATAASATAHTCEECQADVDQLATYLAAPDKVALVVALVQAGPCQDLPDVAQCEADTAAYWGGLITALADDPNFQGIVCGEGIGDCKAARMADCAECTGFIGEIAGLSSNDDLVAKLLAYLSAEGCSSDGCVRYVNEDMPVILPEILNTMNNEGNPERICQGCFELC